MSKSRLIIIAIVLTLAGGFFILSRPKPEQKVSVPAPSASSQNEAPRIVSTKPNPLESGVVSSTDNIEITFNRPLQNIGEFKNKLEPKVDYKVELSSDRKTAKIIFQKPLELGLSYTLSIGPDTKFDGVGAWGESKDFHFRTITYKGI